MPTLDTIARTIDVRTRLACGPGYLVLRDVIDPDARTAALRRLNLEITRLGLTADEIRSGIQGTFFPHLRWEPEVLALQAAAAAIVGVRRGEQWADPQLLLRFPDEAAAWPPIPHVDEVPPWAPDRSYAAIVGVPITTSRHVDGCLQVWPGSHRGRRSRPVPVELDEGDLVIMHPELAHCSGLNRGGAVRYAAYFRLLAAAADEPSPSECSAEVERELEALHRAGEDVALDHRFAHHA